MSSSMIYAQSTVSGKVSDSSNNPIINAIVEIQGSANSVKTSSDGSFKITSKENNGVLVISYLGFESLQVSFSGNQDLGSITLTTSTSEIEEVVVVGKGIVDLVKDRKTPVAVSTIKGAEIQAKIGASDITQVFVNTPSVNVSGQSGGFGDSRISVRGFQQDNTAFLLNGQPINGMEDGKMYWSNWSGMADIANTIQIQRGLGSSKLAISSVGGTVNFVTKATAKKEGGFLSAGVANNDFLKTTIAYNTGKSAKGWGASFLLSEWQGDGYVRGTEGEGQNYFISVGFEPNEKHNFNLLITGAPQFHDQNYTKPISDYLGFGRKYNNNYGYLNGQYLSERKNFYHKPVANFNWDWKISEKMDLSTVLYASWGRGGGTGNYGSGKQSFTEVNPYNGFTRSTYINFDQIYANNAADSNGIGSNENGLPVGYGLTADPYRTKNYVIRASMNNHAWYGIVSNLKTQLTENLNLNLGLDLRTYKGDHYRQISNMLGLNGWYETRRLFNQDHTNSIPGTTVVANNTVTQYMPSEPWKTFFNSIDDNQKIDYDYSETISYGGVFGQLEYQKNNVTAFFQGAVSNQSHQRFDYYDYESKYSDSEKVNNIGFNVKGGGSYSFSEKHTVYGNAGYYSRQPYHDNIYLNFTNALNPLASNEKILGLEAGYTFKSKIFTASLNAYKTTWEDRVITSSTTLATATTIGGVALAAGDVVFTSNFGAKQDHKGVELDFVLKPFENLDIKGFGSYGDWKYKGNTVTKRYAEDLSFLDEKLKDVDGGEVGDAAQTTWGLGARYEIVKNFSIDSDWRNYDRLYANVGAEKENIQLPKYDLVDFGVSYKMLVGKDNKNSLNFRVNINNVFDEVYLSELTTVQKTATETEYINHTGNGLINPAGSPTAPTNFLQGTGNNQYATYQSYQEKGIYKGIDTRNNAFFGWGRTWNVTLTYRF